MHNSQYSLRLYLSHCTKLHTHTHSNHRTSQLPCYVYLNSRTSQFPCYVYATTEHLNSHVMSMQPQNISTPMLCLCNHRTSQLPRYVYANTEHLNSHVMSMQPQSQNISVLMSMQPQNISTKHHHTKFGYRFRRYFSDKFTKPDTCTDNETETL